MQKTASLCCHGEENTGIWKGVISPPNTGSISKDASTSMEVLALCGN